MTAKLFSRVFILIGAFSFCLPAFLFTRMLPEVTAQSCVAPTFQGQASSWTPNSTASSS